MTPTDLGSLVGTVLCDGRYRLVRHLEESPFGSTFLTESTYGSANVVVRFVAESMLVRTSFMRAFGQRVERLRDWADPCFARVLEAGEHEGWPFAVCEGHDGGTLADRWVAPGRGSSAALPADGIATWLETLAVGLDRLHAAGFVYRDLRPGNVLFGPDGRVRLADFALAYAVDRHEREEGHDLTADRSPVGVAEYLCPELVVDGVCDGAGDQYALGVMMYEWLAGRPPFRSKSRSATLAAHTEDDPPPLGLSIPKPVSIAIATALAKDPEDRYPSCTAFATTFLSALGTDMGSIVRKAPRASSTTVRALAEAPPPEQPAWDSDASIDTEDSWGDGGDWDEPVTTSKGDDRKFDDDYDAGDAWSDEYEPVEETSAASRSSTRSRSGSAVQSSTVISHVEPPTNVAADVPATKPYWRRPMFLLASIVGGPLLCAVLYYGYLLFLKPAEQFGPTATFKPNPGGSGPPPVVAPPTVPPAGGGPKVVTPTPPGAADPLPGAVPAATGRPGETTVVAAPKLRSWLDETTVTAKVASDDPIEVLRVIAGSDESPVLDVDVAALSLQNDCGFRLEHEFAETPVREAIGVVAERLPDLCVIVLGEVRGRLSTWGMARRLGANVLDVTPAPAANDADPLETRIAVDVAGKRYATALALVAGQAGIDLEFEDTAEQGPLQERVPAAFFRPAITARELFGALMADRAPFVIARDPERPATLRVTTNDDVRRRGLLLVAPDRVGVEGRLHRPVGFVPNATDPDVPLSTVFSKALETVDLAGGVETDPLSRADLVEPLRESLGRVLVTFGPAEIEEGEEADADRAEATLVEILARTLAEHAEAAIVVDEPGNRVTLTTRAAAEGTGRTPFPVDDSARQRELSRAAANVAPIVNGFGMSFVRIEPGQFRMGAAIGEEGAEEDERPPHDVTITRPFLLGRHEVTQEEFAAITGRNPSAHANTGSAAAAVCEHDTSRFPVENVTWFDAVLFANALSHREGLPPYYELAKPRTDEAGVTTAAEVTVLGGPGYRLPTEAEWEYACRGGGSAPWFFGSGYGADRYVWHAGNSAARTRVVGSRGPNGFGLFDLHGNVREWTDDWYRDDFYPGPTDRDPTGPRWGTQRSVRGGSHSDPLTATRSATRGGFAPGRASPTIGFRLARTPEDAQPAKME